MTLWVPQTNGQSDTTPIPTAGGCVSEEKYKLLKRRLREVTERNEILSHDLNRAKKRLRRLAKEKSILLDRILKYDNQAGRRKVRDQGTNTSPMELVSDLNIGKVSPFTPNESPPTLPVPWQQQQQQQPPAKPQPIQMQPQVLPPPPPPITHAPAAAPPPPQQVMPSPAAASETPAHGQSPSSDQSQSSSQASCSSGRPRVDVMFQDGRMVPSSRPKRMRRGPVEQKLRRVQPLEKDPISGEYKLPARVGILTVHSLGRVVPLPTYHNDRYIWPPGFKVSRTYLSMVNPNANTVYTCSVEENGEQGPRFRVVADDCPDQPIVANSATGVWTAIVKRANEIRNRDHSNSASGPDYYGFTHATIAKMIQDLPGADNCINYVWQKFGEMHERTAAGVAAAAQKKLTNLEIMGSANKRPPQIPPPKQQQRQQRQQQQHQPPRLPPPAQHQQQQPPPPPLAHPQQQPLPPPPQQHQQQQRPPSVAIKREETSISPALQRFSNVAESSVRNPPLPPPPSADPRPVHNPAVIKMEPREDEPMQ